MVLADERGECTVASAASDVDGEACAAYRPGCGQVKESRSRFRVLVLSYGGCGHPSAFGSIGHPDFFSWAGS
jgi:hypothetical protein